MPRFNPIYSIPPAAQLPAMWQHQARAVQFAAERKTVILNYGMGTGKSRVAVELCDSIASREPLRALILCPLAVVSVWPRQFAQWSRRQITFAELDQRAGPSEKKVAYLRKIKLMAEESPECPAIVAINYDSAWRENIADQLRYFNFNLLILDESHKVKDYQSNTSKFVTLIAARIPNRIALTGTPMPHSPLDIFAQMRAINSTVFGSNYIHFRSKYAIIDKRPGFPKIVGFKNQDDLAARTAPYMLSAGRELLDLPPATHTEIFIELSKEARRIYDEIQFTLCAELNEGLISAKNGLVKLIRLQQLTGGTVPREDFITGEQAGQIVDTSKAEALQELLESLPAGEPVTVFCRYRADLDAVHRAAAALKRKSLELSGTRKELLRWQSGEAPILAVQISAGGVGIDLTRAAYCVFYSLGYSLGDYEQALARSHRPGQRRTVSYYHLIARNTIDGIIYKALQKKADIVNAVLDDIKNQELEFGDHE